MSSPPVAGRDVEPDRPWTAGVDPHRELVVRREVDDAVKPEVSASRLGRRRHTQRLLAGVHPGRIGRIPGPVGVKIGQLVFEIFAEDHFVRRRRRLAQTWGDRHEGKTNKHHKSERDSIRNMHWYHGPVEIVR